MYSGVKQHNLLSALDSAFGFAFGSAFGSASLVYDSKPNWL